MPEPEENCMVIQCKGKPPAKGSNSDHVYRQKIPQHDKDKFCKKSYTDVFTDALLNLFTSIITARFDNFLLQIFLGPTLCLWGVILGQL